MHTISKLRLSFFLLLLAGAFGSCSDPVPPATPPDGGSGGDGSTPPAYFDTIGPVSADGILETVTWNLEWYGDEENGPADEGWQTRNFLKVLDTLNADLYAFEEVGSTQALERLTSKMKGYRGFVATGMPRDQKTAFVYNTNVIDSVSSGLITQGQDYNDWASGRFPFYFKFNYHAPDQTYTIFAVVIHAKCCANYDSYYRRLDAAQDLYDYLAQHEPNANIILLGDYNDDVDVSIYHGWQTPYEPFVENNAAYDVVTKAISENHQGTTVDHGSAIDHIAISNELFDKYIPGSAKVFVQAGNLIDHYENTTSDHYPVWAKFDLR